MSPLITSTQLRQIAGKPAIPFAVPLCLVMSRFQINTPLRVAHFIAQLAEESAGFRYLEEIWGPTEAQKGYEGRADLGNTQAGDGYRYRGRGLIMLTGRYNYTKFSKAVGADFVSNPDALATPYPGTLVGGWYWDAHNLNLLADADDLLAITKKINGGTRGLAARRHYLELAKAAL